PPATQPAHRLPLHLARPQGGAAHLASGRRDVPRQAGRGRRARCAVRRAAAPLHASADRCRAGARSQPPHAPRDPARRSAQPDRSAGRLPLPHPLPRGDAAMQADRAPAGRRRQRALGRMPPGRAACGSERRMKIVAHRGDCARFPENSLAAFEHAIRAGADLLETDVRIAADGVPVCWHDPDLARVTGTATPIAGTTAAGLAAIALPGDARVHRLEEILAIARGRRPLMLDLKVDDAPARAAIMRAVALADMADEVVLGVRTPEQAAAYAATGRPLALLAMPAEPEGLSGFSP